MNPTNPHKILSANATQEPSCKPLSPTELSERMKFYAERAAAYLDSRGFQVEQRNGQRISVPRQGRPLPVGNQRDKQTREVFVGKLPRDLFEDELLPAMERAGRVLKIRLMMDFSGTNRGFGFVEYASHQEAVLACSLLDQSELRRDAAPIGVILSFNNKRLYFGELPADITAQRLADDLRKLLEGVKHVDVPEGQNGNQDKFALVTFDTHDAATQARRLLLPGGTTMYDREITIDWAKPEVPTIDQRALDGLALIDANNNNNNSSSSASSATIPAKPQAKASLSRPPYMRKGTAKTSPKSANSPPVASPRNPLAKQSTRSGHQQHHQAQTRSYGQANLLANKFVGLQKAPFGKPAGICPMSSASNLLTCHDSALNIANGISTLSLADQVPPLATNSILGPRAQLMLADLSNHQQQQQQPCNLSDTLGFSSRSITIHGINVTEVGPEKLKRIFSFQNQLPLADLKLLGPSSISLVYFNPEHAQAILETLVIMPHCFQQLAIPGHMLHPVKEFASNTLITP